EEGVQIVPFVQRGNKRPDFTVTRLVVRQQLELVTAVEVQQRAARQAVGAQRIQFVKREDAFNEVFPQHRIVQAAIFLHGQPRRGFKKGGGEQPDTLLAAPVAVFII